MVCSSNIPKLKEFLGKSDSCIEVLQNQKVALKVWPQYFNDLKTGILEALEKLTGGYNKRFGGILLGYENVKVCGESGWIYGYIHIHVVATLYIFTPREGMTIKARVTDHTDVKTLFIALDKFNVTLHKKRVSNFLKNKNKKHDVYEFTAMNYKKLLEDTEWMLKLFKVDMYDFRPNLEGYLVPEDASLSTSMTPEKVSVTNGLVKKVRFNESALESDAQSACDIFSSDKKDFISKVPIKKEVEVKMELPSPDSEEDVKVSVVDAGHTPMPSKKKKKKKKQVEEKPIELSFEKVKKKIKKEKDSIKSEVKVKKKRKLEVMDESFEEDFNQNRKPKKRRKIEQQQ